MNVNWIPVSERLPTEEGLYLCAEKYGWSTGVEYRVKIREFTLDLSAIDEVWPKQPGFYNWNDDFEASRKNPEYWLEGLELPVIE